MRELVPSIAAALTPLILLVILLVGPTLGLVKWQPSLLWHTEFGAVGHGITSKVTAISVDKTGLYTAGYLGTYSNVTGPSSNRKSTRLNSSHRTISYAVFCLKKKTAP